MATVTFARDHNRFVVIVDSSSQPSMVWSRQALTGAGASVWEPYPSRCPDPLSRQTQKRLRTPPFSEGSQSLFWGRPLCQEAPGDLNRRMRVLQTLVQASDTS
jgi:hypothetical protein